MEKIGEAKKVQVERSMGDACMMLRLWRHSAPSDYLLCHSPFSLWSSLLRCRVEAIKGRDGHCWRLAI
jgi:hypothetical protein